jgi:2,5-diamino-6-(ribosylamino)-4(3H)-pyrimidinone 5'-phosphate reductase
MLEPAAAGLPRIVAGEKAVDLGAALAALRTEYGVRWLLGEGGPTLNHRLLVAGLVDELFLTLAPKLVAGSAPTIVTGEPFPEDAPVPLRLLTLHADGDELYLRYRVGA